MPAAVVDTVPFRLGDIMFSRGTSDFLVVVGTYVLVLHSVEKTLSHSELQNFAAELQHAGGLRQSKG